MVRVASLRLLLLAGILPAVAPGARAQAGDGTPERQPPLVWDAEARVHTAAQRIVRGVLRVDREDLAGAQQDSQHVRVVVEACEHVLGPPAARVAFRVYVRAPTEGARDDEFAAAQLLALDGHERVVYLGAPGARFLAGWDHHLAVREPDEAFLERVRHRQRLHEAMAQQPLAIEREREERIRAILRRIVRDEEHQQRAFAQLLALGEPDVPALIAAMDDRRRLPVRSIRLENRAADAFEPYRRYGPELVVDAVDAILNQLTWESFGSIQNGASDAEREACVRGWRIYAHYLTRRPR